MCVCVCLYNMFIPICQRQWKTFFYETFFASQIRYVKAHANSLLLTILRNRFLHNFNSLICLSIPDTNLYFCVLYIENEQLSNISIIGWITAVLWFQNLNICSTNWEKCSKRISIEPIFFSHFHLSPNKLNISVNRLKWTNRIVYMNRCRKKSIIHKKIYYSIVSIKAHKSNDIKTATTTSEKKKESELEQ